MTELVPNGPAFGNGAPELGTIERVIATGDLARMAPEERARYYLEVCRSVGLNPLTQPLQYIVLNGRLVLYATRAATDQLRALHGVSVAITAREVVGDLYVVSARATLPNGRADEEIGAVPVAGLKGDALANAWMKAITKAKRRVTLAICGLGMLDESELETIADARVVHVEDAHQPEAQPEAPRPLSPRMQAVLSVRGSAAHDGDEMDAAEAEGAAATSLRGEIEDAARAEVAERRARRAALIDDEPRATSEVWDQVLALAAELDAAGVRYSLPPRTGTTEQHGIWLVRLTRALNATRPAR